MIDIKDKVDKEENEQLRSIFEKVKPFLAQNIGDLVHSPDSFRFIDQVLFIVLRKP